MTPIIVIICFVIGVAVHILLTASYRDDVKKYKKLWKGQMELNEQLVEERDELKDRLSEFVVGENDLITSEVQIGAHSVNMRHRRLG